MSHKQNNDGYSVKIRFRFFSFLNFGKTVFFNPIRLFLWGNIHLNPGRFSHIRESVMLKDIVTKDCKILNNCLFNARN